MADLLLDQSLDAVHVLALDAVFGGGARRWAGHPAAGDGAWRSQQQDDHRSRMHDLLRFSRINAIRSRHRSRRCRNVAGRRHACAPVAATAVVARCRRHRLLALPPPVVSSGPRSSQSVFPTRSECATVRRQSPVATRTTMSSPTGLFQPDPCVRRRAPDPHLGPAPVLRIDVRAGGAAGVDDAVDAPGPWDPTRAVAWCVWAAYPTLSFLGVFKPLKMLPVMLFMLFYKGLWLAFVVYPLWSTGQLAGSPADEMAHVFMWVWIPALFVPWGYVARTYLPLPRRRVVRSGRGGQGELTACGGHLDANRAQRRIDVGFGVDHVRRQADAVEPALLQHLDHDAVLLQQRSRARLSTRSGRRHATIAVADGPGGGLTRQFRGSPAGRSKRDCAAPRLWRSTLAMPRACSASTAAPRPTASGIGPTPADSAP